MRSSPAASDEVLNIAKVLHLTKIAPPTVAEERRGESRGHMQVVSTELSAIGATDPAWMAGLPKE